MAWWGKANALGPNYNNPEMTAEASKAAHESVQNALAVMGDETDAEKSLIQALQARYPNAQSVPHPPLDTAYAEAMRKLRASYPDDADVAALCAEALMQLNPWKPTSTPSIACTTTTSSPTAPCGPANAKSR